MPRKSFFAMITPLQSGGGEQPPAGGGGRPDNTLPGDLPGGPDNSLPPFPAHPIVIPPDGIAPGVPTHPIFLPPIVEIPGFPTPPIYIPPDGIAPGVPTHPIVIPPGIWGPTDPRPDQGLPEPQPPAGGSGGRPDNTLPGDLPAGPDNSLPPIQLPPLPEVPENSVALVMVKVPGQPAEWVVINGNNEVEPLPPQAGPKGGSKGQQQRRK